MKSDRQYKPKCSFVLLCCLILLVQDNFVTVTSISNNVTPFAQQVSGKMILAPLTRGGNLPFRRLCADFGMEVSLGEMVYARSLIKNDRIEQARLRRAPNENFFGVQIATNQIDEGTKAIAMAAEAGADFVDLNCGCPIYEATRRGLGSSLLRSPKKLGKLVAGMVAESSKTNGGIPISVKIRLGCESSSINVNEVVQSVCEAGASAVTIHGRTAQQGYSKAADWDLIRDVTSEIATANSGVPIIGNGDILTHFEANRRMESYGVDAVMVGRGALTKPWIFQEFNSKQTWNPSLDDRIAVYRNLALHMKDHFGDDDMGRKKSWHFLPWHFEFLSRYMYHPEEDFATVSVDQPLIQSRSSIPTDASPLQILLSHRSKDAHDLIADALWCSDSSEDAVSKLCVVSESHVFQEILKKCNESEIDGDSTTELSNIPSSSKRSGGRWHKRRGRDPKPQRTPEEIAIIRAERAAKKAASLEAEAQNMPQI